ncbi:tetratricopeptide repeat protein [Magnetococcales bacterium HHB-1]
MSLKPSDVQQRYEQARSFYHKQRYSESVELCKTLLAEQPEHAPTLHLLGLIAKELKQHQNALLLITQAIKHAPEQVDYYINLGAVLSDLEKNDEATTILEKANLICPDNADLLFNLGVAYHRTQRLEEAVEAYQKSILIHDNATTHFNLAAVFQEQGDLEQALKAYQATLKIRPDFPSAQHMAAALSGACPNSAPQTFVKRLFDKYATNFDDHLEKVLRYRGPMLFRQILEQAVGLGHTYQNAIDLGAGTGLTGQALRPLISKMSAIDLSPKMIEVARSKNIYNQLFQGDIIKILDNMPEARFDLFIAADTFVYIGQLLPLFQTIKKHAHPGAHFLFSTEKLISEDQDFSLHTSGRYAHSKNYIQSICQQCQFIEQKVKTADLRTENNHQGKTQWVEADIYLVKVNK